RSLDPGLKKYKEKENRLLSTRIIKADFEPEKKTAHTLIINKAIKGKDLKKGFINKTKPTHTKCNAAPVFALSNTPPALSTSHTFKKVSKPKRSGFLKSFRKLRINTASISGLNLNITISTPLTADAIKKSLISLPASSVSCISLNVAYVIKKNITKNHLVLP
ncbi:TPA: hypothetical protein ACM5K7_004775, partial [Escherichia coli]